MTLSEQITEAFNDATFAAIFGDRFDFIVHKSASALNGGNFFWKEGVKTEHKGLTDIAPAAYIRYESEQSSGSYSEDSKGIVYNLRFLASLPGCKNSGAIAGYIVRRLYSVGLEVGTINLNEVAVWTEEMGGERNLRSNNVDFISIEFSGVDFLPTVCDTENLFLETC